MTQIEDPTFLIMQKIYKDKHYILECISIRDKQGNPLLLGNALENLSQVSKLNLVQSFPDFYKWPKTKVRVQINDIVIKGWLDTDTNVIIINLESWQKNVL